MKKIKYLAYYNSQNDQARNVSVAAVNKMDYIISAINDNNIEVEIISASSLLLPGVETFCKQSINEKSTLTLLPSLRSEYKIVNKILSIIFSIQLFCYLLFTLSKNDTVLVYHSLGFMRIVAFLKKLKKFKLILEVEEIYSDVINNKPMKKKELSFFKLADSYLFPTIKLNELINTENKPHVIIHGTYNVEDKLAEKFHDGKIHCIYAGTFDPRKGGALTSIESAKYLNEKYHLHILGFGDDQEIVHLKDLIKKNNSRNKCHISYHGLLKGKEYLKLLQQCHIGLSTQNPNAEFNDTSFPSKILSYLSNDLDVVSIKINVLETSEVNCLLTYYANDDVQALTQAIMSVNLKSCRDKRKFINNLHKTFTVNINNLITIGYNNADAQK